LTKLPFEFLDDAIASQEREGLDPTLSQCMRPQHTNVTDGQTEGQSPTDDPR